MQNKLKLLIFSDLHYAPTRPINNGSRIDRKLTDLAVPLLDKLIEKSNTDIKPDVVLNLGDLVEDFNDKAMDLENIEYIFDKFGGFDAAFYTLAGNHDLRSMDSRVEVEQIMGYSHSTFSVDIGGYHFVFLGLNVDSSGSHAEGGIYKTQFISQKDLEWLKEDIASNTLPTIYLCHFGIAEDDMAGNWWFWDNPHNALLGNRAELKDILKTDENILAVFSGHQHWTKHHIEDGIEYHVIGSMTENLHEDDIPDGIYFVVELNGRDINIVENHIRL